MNQLRDTKNRFLPIHGERNSKEYIAWDHMKARCYNPNTKNYKWYGAKDIKVCDRWINSFENFLADMGKSPSIKHSLDRKDSTKDYCPENCRWSDDKTQQRNRTNTIIYQLNGETKSLAEWAEIHNILLTTVRSRLKNGWDILKALQKPIDIKSRNKKAI